MWLFLLKGLKELLSKLNITSIKLTIFKLEEISILIPSDLNALIISFYSLDVLGPLLFDMNMNSSSL